MPFIYAHQLCAENTLPLLYEARLIVDTNSGYYYCGCQGPDIWFYHRAAPWWIGKSCRQFARYLHGKNIEKTFRAMLEAVCATSGRERDKRFAYLCGFFTHYALDSAAHPYVLYFSGGKTNHTRLERDMDIALFFNENEPEKKPAEQSHPLTDFLPVISARPLSALYCAAAAGTEFAALVNTETTATALADCRACLKVMYDPRGIKYAVFGTMEKAVRKRGSLTRVIYYNKLSKANIDPLNLSNRRWQKPWGRHYYYSSFPDIMEKAQHQAARFINEAYAVVYRAADSAELFKDIGSRSFSTGEDWRATDSLEKRYSSCIYN